MSGDLIRFSHIIYVKYVLIVKKNYISFVVVSHTLQKIFGEHTKVLLNV